MTSVHHTPHGIGAPLTSPEVNRPLGELDAAIASVIATGSGASTSLTSQALLGQKNLVVADRAGWAVGDVFWIGYAGGTYESGVIASGTGAGAGTLVAVVNLVSTYASGTPVSKSPVEIVNARGTHATLGARLATLSQFLWAKDYGVKADGTTDDTAACQSALNALVGSSAKGVMFPAGTIRLTAALTIPFVQFKSILGAGWGITVFRQDTNNVPVFKSATSDTHSIEFGECTLTYLNVQTSANTGAIALNFADGVSMNWYYWNVRRVFIERAHIGIGTGGPGATGSLSVWNCSFSQVVLGKISQSLIKLVSPTAGGMPVNTFRDITHLGNGGVAPAGPAIDLAGCEAVFLGLDIEDWYNRLIYTIGGGPVTINGLHVERHILNGTLAMIEVGDGPLIINSADIDWAVQGGVAAKLYQVLAGASLSVRGTRLRCTLTSGTIVGLTSAADARSVDLAGIQDDNSNVPFGLANDIAYVGPFNPIYCNGAQATNANEANLYAFTVPRAVRVGKVRIDVGAGSGNVDAGIYDAAGTRLASTGSTAMSGGPTSQLINLTGSVLLLPGRKYYAAVAMNNGTGTIQSFSMGTSNTAAALAVATKVATSFPLPSTIVVGTSAPIRVYAPTFEP